VKADEVGLRVAVGFVEVGCGVFPGAFVLVGATWVEVGAAVVGRRVGEGPTVGTVWKSRAPQVWR
jgi:hypothetical protein